MRIKYSKSSYNYHYQQYQRSASFYLEASDYLNLSSYLTSSYLCVHYRMYVTVHISLPLLYTRMVNFFWCISSQHSMPMYFYKFSTGIVYMWSIVLHFLSCNGFVCSQQKPIKLYFKCVSIRTVFSYISFVE